MIIKPSSLGDIVLALPALSAIRRSFSDSHIAWLIRPEFAPLIEYHPALDEIILFDRKRLAGCWHSPHAFSQLLELFSRLHKPEFDTVIDFQGLIRTGLFSLITGANERIGPADAREFASLFYTHKVSQPAYGRHLVDLYLQMVAQTGASDLRVEFTFPVNLQAGNSVDKLLAENNIAPKNYVVFVPASAQLDKCWPLERFAKLAEKLKSDFNLLVIASGTPSEKPLIDKLVSLSKVPIINFAGKTTIPQLVSLLSKSRLVVSNDTGPGHIAAALNVPLVMIFSWSNPARIYPYNHRECAAGIDLFTRGKKIKSKNQAHNVNNVTFDMVWQKVTSQLTN
ncbi:MAG: glycosyltransferase family 9 protein [Phycisphaerae bacterium]|nr:glycosyltransferase family 9 protein [Phycisphaerae bacterium]